MRAVILAGGRGTRLRPYTTVLPKPLVPIGERPILSTIIHQLARSGFEHIDISIGHLGELIRAYFSQDTVAPSTVEIAYHTEDEPLGTAGALKAIDPPEDSFLVMNGDILTTLDYAGLMRFHRDRDAALTIATHHRDVALSLGVIESADGEVHGFVEKPTLHYEVSMGIYVYSQRALDHLPGGHFDFPELVLALLDAGESVASHHFEGAWFDVGTRDEHERAMEAYEANPGLFEPPD
jgi:NDP-mannose synthase